MWLGRFHEAVGRIVDQLGRPIRRHGDNHKGRDYTKVLPITWTVHRARTMPVQRSDYHFTTDTSTQTTHTPQP